jgi:spore photoproduct lyase
MDRREFIKQFGGTEKYPDIVCFRFWQLVVAAGCPFRCNYCYLQSIPSHVFGHYPLEGVLFRNWRQMISELEVWLERAEPSALLVGELQDGLAFDGAYKRLAGESLTEMVVPRFRVQRKHRCVFLTKSVPTRYALQMEPTDRVVFSWSVNAEEFGRRHEKGAPLPSRRLAAAGEMKARGWPVRVRLDPMFPFEGWRDGYQRTIDLINGLGPEMVTIGAFRASNTLKAHARKRGRDVSIFDTLTEKDPSGMKWRLPYETHLELLQFAVEHLDDALPVALCKEDKSVWEAAGLQFRGCHCLLGPDDKLVEEHWNGPSPV